MACIYRFQGQTLQGITDPALPGTTGYGDQGTATVGQHSVAFDNIRNGTFALPGRTVPVVRFVDNALGGEPFWSSRPGVFPNSSPASITGPWSMRLYYRRPTSTTVTMPVVRFQDGTTTQVYIYFATPGASNRFRTATSTLGTVIASGSSQQMFRLEIQVDPARSPKLVCRVYAGDGTTPISAFTDNPAVTTWNNFDIGHFITGNFTASEVQYADLEVHDDYDLGGQFTSNPASPTAASETATGVPSVTPTVAAAYNYDAGTNRTLPAATLVAGTDYTVTTDISYTTAGTFGRALDLYIPTGTPPAGGWPIVCWAHSGFFTGGSKAQLPTAWRDDLLANGYAVASIQYVLSSIDAAAPYDSYGGGGNRGGRYPSHILDYKRAAAFLRDKASTASGGDNTYPTLNGSKMFATGFSAGGYVALGAAVTRGLTVDSVGNEMSLAAATSAGDPWADGYTGTDPEFLGAFVYAAPVNLDLSVTWDPTFPASGGTLNAAYRAFQGLLQTGAAAPTAPHTSLAALIGLNPANVPDVAYVRGTADYLVHWEHEAALETAMTGAAGDYTEFTTPNNHDRANLIYDDSSIVGWMNARVTSGTPASVAPGTVARTVAVPAPTVSTTATVQVNADTVSGTVAVPAPTVSTTSTGSATVTPDTVTGTIVAPAPTVTATSSAQVTPGVVTATTGVPAPTVSTSGGANVPGALVATTATVPAPSVTTTSSAQVTPGVVGVTVTARDAGVQVEGAQTVSPPRVQVAAQVPAPSVSGSDNTAPGTVARSVTVPTPTVTTTASVTPGPVGIAVDVNPSTASSGEAQVREARLLPGRYAAALTTP